MPRRHHKVVARPVKGGIMDDGVARRIDHLASVWILVPGQRLCAVADHELVFIANPGSWHFHRPIAIALTRERMRRRAPVVESAGSADTRRERRPDAKRDA